MRHSKSGRKLNRNPAHRKALFRNMSRALLEYGRIRTTEAKAMELRRVIEPLVTMAKRDDLHARREAYKFLNSHQLVQKLFDQIVPLFAGVPGGYTRVIKLGLPRPGDAAPLAVIEFTKDINAVESSDSGKTKSDAKPAAKKAAPAADTKAEKPAVAKKAAPKSESASVEASEEKPKRARKPKAEEDA